MARALYMSALSRARTCKAAGRVMRVLTRYREAAEKLHKVFVVRVCVYIYIYTHIYLYT